MVVYIVSLIYTFMDQDMVRNFLMKICALTILIFMFELIRILWWFLKWVACKGLKIIKRIAIKAKSYFYKIKNVDKKRLMK